MLQSSPVREEGTGKQRKDRLRPAGLTRSTEIREIATLPFLSRPVFDTTPQIKSPMPVEGQDLAVACARAAEEILAEDIKILDLQGISSLTDFMVICSGNSMPHLKAILREVEAKVHGFTEAKPLYTEGRADSRWVVLDYVDVMVHIMHGEMRKLYALEDLWGDASMIQWES